MKPRRHPLGVESHPEWDGVWTRYINRTPMDPLMPPEPANDAEPEGEVFPTRAVLWGMAICMGLAAILVGAVVA